MFDVWDGRNNTHTLRHICLYYVLKHLENRLCYLATTARTIACRLISQIVAFVCQPTLPFSTKQAPLIRLSYDIVKPYSFADVSTSCDAVPHHYLCCICIFKYMGWCTQLAEVTVIERFIEHIIHMYLFRMGSSFTYLLSHLITVPE